MSFALHLWRPEPGWSTSARMARDLGLEVAGQPLFRIAPVPWTAPNPAEFDAVLIGSVNVLRHGGTQLHALRHLPVHAVGETTARAAREAGFTVASIGKGGLQTVVDGLEGPTRLLRLRGEAAVELKLSPTIEVADGLVYTARPTPPSEATKADLRRGGIAALHSAEAGRRFAALVDLYGTRSDWSLALIGPRLRDAVKDGWRTIVIAEMPCDSALLAIAAPLCKKG